METKYFFIVLFAITRNEKVTSSPLSPISFNDGPCLKLPPIRLEDLDFELALQFAVDPGYVPLASKLNYFSTAQMLRKDVFNNLQDLQDVLCLKLATGLFQSILTGFDGAKVELACDLMGIGSVSCYDKTDPASGNTTIHVVWSDNKRYMLSISCLPSGHAAWNVLSSADTVDAESKERIFAELAKYGFDRRNAMSVSYENC